MDRARAGQMGGVQWREAQSEAVQVPVVRPRFPELFEAFGGYIWSTLRRLGARPSELDDLTHDVFVQVFRHLDEYDQARPIKPWLFGFAFRIASEDRRRARRRPELVVDSQEPVDLGPTPVEHLLAQERRELAWAVLSELELDQRAVFILHELDGCPIPEVAEGLGIPVPTAYSRLRLARADFNRIARRLRSRQR